MNATLEVSVVIPTYNRREHLSRTLDALARQHMPARHFEVIVINDGGEDGTDELVQERARRYPVSLRLRNPGHRGPAAARNEGIREARGRIVAFTDDDCLPEPDWLPALIKALEADKNLAGVGGLTLPPENAGFIAKYIDLKCVMRTPEIKGGEVLHLQTNNAAFTKEALLSVGGFDESFPSSAGEDWELCHRLTKKGWKLGFAPEARLVHAHRRTLAGFIKTYYNYGRAEAIMLRTDPRAVQILRGLYRARLLLAWLLIPWYLFRNIRETEGPLLEALIFAGLEAGQRAALTAGYLRGLPQALSDRSPHAGALS